MVRLIFGGILVAALAAAQSSEPVVFFVSPGGDDARSGLSESQAWRSLVRVQRALDTGVPAEGAEVRFERGGTWAGSLAIRSYTGPRLRLTAYGEGPAPVLSGTVALDRWESLGEGLWRAECPACTVMPNLLLRDGVALRLARWPNEDEANRGYLNYEAAEGRTQISDEQLAEGSDWTGAEAVLRSAAWILDRLPVIRQEGKTLVFGGTATYAIPRGYGYFLQNHKAALDQDGEWMFDAATRRITVLLKDSAPGDYRFEAAVRESVLTVSRSRNVEILDLHLAGARRVNLEITDSEGLLVRGVESRGSGDAGMRFLNCKGLRVEGSVMEGALSHGLDVFNCSDCRVERNRVLNTATLAGMGRSGNSQYNGVRFGGTNAVFADNVVSRTGYLGIDVRGAATITQNIVSEFNLVKTDGGGIYTWGNRDVEITDNLVRDGEGSREGVPWNSNATHGIYIDDQSENVLVKGNTVINVASHGVYLHNTRNVRVAENTVVGAREPAISFIDDNLGTHTVSETAVENNVFAATTPGVLLARASTTGGPEFFQAIGTMTGNRYCTPFSEPVFGSSAAGQSRLLPAQWQKLVGTDGDARFCPFRIPLFTDVSVTGPSRVGNGTFDRDLTGWFGWPGDSLKATWVDGKMELRHVGSAPIIHYDTPVGVLEAGTFFRVRFEAHSDQPQRWMKVYLRKWDPDYRLLADAVDLLLTDKPQKYEFVIPVRQNETRSLLIFELPLASQVVWLDNVVLEPVKARALDPSGVARVETNPTGEVRTVTLDEDYVDVDGVKRPAGSDMAIAPFRSLVLFRAAGL